MAQADIDRYGLPDPNAKTPSPSYSFAEYSPEMRALADIHDVLGQVLTAIVLTNDGKIGKLPSYPRPESAYARIVKTIERREAIAELEFFTSVLTPNEK